MANYNQEKLTKKEQTVLQLIQQDPYISQQALAASVNLSRPSVANIISGLIRKNFILGKAYILNDTEPVVCIGAANVDRKYYAKGHVQWGTSNPITSTGSVGGVARNIAENLGRLGLETTLLTAGGADADWSFIKETSSLYMNVNEDAIIPGAATGSYTAVLNPDGEMELALADMEVYESMTPAYINRHEKLLHQAKCIAADLNCPKETLQLLCHKADQYHIPLMLAAVSAPKMDRLPDELEGVSWLIMNQEESVAAFGMNITNDTEWKDAAEKWLQRGVSNVVITAGSKGAMIGNRDTGVIHVPALSVEHTVDVTGAGDAFCAGLLYAWLEGKEITAIAEAAMINAAETLRSPLTVRENLTAAQLEKEMEERK